MRPSVAIQWPSKSVRYIKISGSYGNVSFLWYPYSVVTCSHTPLHCECKCATLTQAPSVSPSSNAAGLTRWETTVEAQQRVGECRLAARYFGQLRRSNYRGSGTRRGPIVTPPAHTCEARFRYRVACFSFFGIAGPLGNDAIRHCRFHCDSRPAVRRTNTVAFDCASLRAFQFHKSPLGHETISWLRDDT